MTFRDIDTTGLSDAALKRRIALITEAAESASKAAARAKRAASVAVGRYHTLLQLKTRAESDEKVRRTATKRTDGRAIMLSRKIELALDYQRFVQEERGKARQFARSVGVPPRTLRRWVVKYLET